MRRYEDLWNKIKANDKGVTLLCNKQRVDTLKRGVKSEKFRDLGFKLRSSIEQFRLDIEEIEADDATQVKITFKLRTKFGLVGVKDGRLA
jgi:hypothetical protein